MAIASNSIVSSAHRSLSQPGTHSHPLPSSSISLPPSPSLSLKLIHRSISPLHCSSNVPDTTENDTPHRNKVPSFSCCDGHRYGKREITPLV
ncbi:Thioesterase superfamily protein isoform 2 [Hibiscus syriacus]|uniref:Thioesterase superfamily protein isoform 2 n=1 Tax=Hibiscus syriacus TaxID=106335 RepID=A0A6A2YER4_HIBSY|nr:Thioesterase superfamily protein isoform 2 [Hibiscus syriacus]